MEQKEKFYKKLWFMWLLIIFFPPIGIIFMWVTKKEMKAGKKVLITVAGLLWWLICSTIGNLGGENESGNKNETTTSAEATTAEETSEATTTEEVTLEPFELELTAGRYEAGIDFPEGTYSLTCISGSGNVNSSNMYAGGLNEVMSTDASDEYSIDSFNNAQFSNGVILSIASTAVIKISSEGVDKNSMSERVTSGTEIELSSGNFTAGTDFEPGVYDITCITGSGNVYSDNMYDGGLNEVMSADTSDGYSITTFKNAKFEEGAQLSVSGCTIKLTPSK